MADIDGNAVPSTSKEPQERRNGARTLCSELVRVTFRDQTGEPVRQTGLLEDLSRDGLCVSLPYPLPVGAEIDFACDGFLGQARVEYCHIGLYSYLAGAKFSNGLVWNRSVWRPSHFLLLGDKED